MLFDMTQLFWLQAEQASNCMDYMGNLTIELNFPPEFTDKANGAGVAARRKCATMIKDAYTSKSGFGHFFQAPCRTFRSCTWLLLCLLLIHGLPNASGQQSSNSPNTAASRTIQDLKPVRPKELPRQPTTLSRTRSIVQPASHQEMIIPNALELESDAHDIVHEVCQPTFEGYDNVLDYVADSRCHGGRYYFLDWSRADLWIGTSGFTNPASAFVTGANTLGQVEGSFGFQEGFNFGSQLPSLLSGQVGAQLGMRFVQSNLDGSGVSDASRNQMFATAGLFRRIDYGFQGGLVVDYLRDQWVYKADLWQLRGELSFLFSPAHEVGFRFTDGGRTHRQNVRLSSGTSLNIELQPMDTYRLFGRMRFGHCAANTAEVQVGTSDDGGLLLGCVLQNPLSGQIGLETAATYFRPQSSVTNADTREAWNLSLALVWTPGRLFGTHRDYNRPLFDVAGNGSFIASRP
jgi:hypothetical protein